MALTVGETFDLLFGASASDGSLAMSPSYEERRWFRRPRPFDLTENQTALAALDAERAESILMEKILSCLPTWRQSLKTATSGSVLERISASNPAAKARLDAGSLRPGRHLPPRSPYDVFAIAAYLIDAAGIYHHIQAEKTVLRSGFCGLAADAHLNDSPRHLGITVEDRVQVMRVARAWRGLSKTKVFGTSSAQPLAREMVTDATWQDLEPLFESWAIVFGAYAKAEVFVRLSSHVDAPEPPPGWWKHVWRLLAIADEAAKGTGYNFDSQILGRALDGEDAGLEWFEAELFAEFAVRVRRDHGQAERDPMSNEYAAFDSLSAARGEIVCVLPKVRTPAVGCTLRSLSHHLAITPGQGVARGRWTPSFERNMPREGGIPGGQMNLLLVPFPFTINASAFCGSLAEDRPDPATGQTPSETRYGYFDVHQEWLAKPPAWPPPGREGHLWEDEIVAFVRALVEAAKRQSPKIHGLIFPELALNNDVFKRIRAYLEEEEKDIEIFVSGVSEKPYDRAGFLDAPEPDAPGPPVRHGNFVSVASFNRGQGAEIRRLTVREKHHRWKLDRPQIRDYGLLGVLSPELDWWENISLQSRRVDFSVIRDRIVLSAMICEDLARVDPCQQVIRSVAPNLVVALLMDAPQRSARWPARYATVLAEDPGCAVLTMTSRGLMARQHRLGIYGSNGSDRIVAMWRDDRSERPVELDCPYDAQGLLLTVVEEPSQDVSLDGRVDGSAIAMRYAGHVPVRIPDGRRVFAAVLGEEEKSC